MRLISKHLSLPISCWRHTGYFSLLAALLFTASVHAQQPIPPPDTVFPLGGLQNGVNESDAGTELPKFGLNMLYNAAPGTPGVLLLDVANLNALFPQGTGAYPPTPGWNPLFAELDCDLATNETDASGKPTSDAWDVASNQTTVSGAHFWGLTTGKINGNGEWEISSVENDLSSEGFSGYFLHEFDNANTGTDLAPIWNEIIDPGTFTGIVRSPENPNPASTFYIDFVYRITGTSSDPAEYVLECNPQTTPGTTVSILYSVDDGITWNSPESGKSWDNVGVNNIPVYYTDYFNYIGQSLDPTMQPRLDLSLHPKETPNLLGFPRSTLNPSSLPQPYAVLRIKVTLSGGTLLSNYTSNLNGQACPIILNLRGVAANGIYVRGVRIRSDWADDLYRGEFDSHSTATDGHALNLYYTYKDAQNNDHTQTLSGGLADVFSHLHSIAGHSWSSALGFNIGNDCNWESFRCFAYINEQFRDWSRKYTHAQKDFFTFVANTQGPGNFTFWRAIYEDQSNGKQPPAFQNEAFQIGANFSAIANTYAPGSPVISRPDHDFASSFENPLIPGDAIPSAVKNHPGFIEMGRTFTGWNGLSSPCTFELFTSEPMPAVGTCCARPSPLHIRTLHLGTNAGTMSKGTDDRKEGYY